MDGKSELIVLGVTAFGLLLVGLVRPLLPQPTADGFVRLAAWLAVVAAGAVGGYWLVSGSRADQLPGSVLAASCVVGLAILARGARPPQPPGE
ncbi:MAG: hypothetical protein K2V38_26045 [Gemmataceae bacterium]|nr:hypothetical protein [Gemmataceae bacterium]